MAENVPNLGALITDDKAARDAVHVAVVPCVARRQLKPGEHVAAALHHKDWVCAPAGDEPIGVVDPYLKAPVKKGEQFWLFLYPGTAVGLRHVYRHPVLDAEEIRRETIEMLHPECIPEMKACAAALRMRFEEFLEILRTAERDPEYYHHMGQNESYRDYDWEKIWKGYEIVTGGKRPESRYGTTVPFSCSC